MTTSHLSMDLIKQICQLYEMDARPMMMVGFRTMCANPDGRQTKNWLNCFLERQAPANLEILRYVTYDLC